MAFFKAKIGDTVYELDKLTLGDTRILKHKFGLSDLSEFSSTDPDVIVGLLSLSIRKANPALTIEQAAAQADEINFDDFTQVADEKEVAGAEDADAAPLAPVDASVATVSPEPSGSPETTPETPGTPVTPTS